MRKTLCASCKKYFSSTGEFDAHRSRKHCVRESDPRKCLTTAQMTVDGWQSEPLKITDEPGKPIRDVWFRKSLRDGMKARFARLAGAGMPIAGPVA